jgi:hypothetical protein
MGNTQPTPPNGELRATGTLDIKDSRTDKTYSVKILQGGVEGDTASPAMDLRQIKTSPDEFGLMTYDPAFMNTASCKSAITFIDGDKGILRYRGYPIEQLAERASFLEVAYLLIHGGKDKGHGGPTMGEIEIPWIISGPGVLAGREIRSYVNTYDTAATIAHIFGLKTPSCWIGKPVLEAFKSTKVKSN